MSRKCPVTEQTCHDSRCQIGTHDGRDGNGCEIMRYNRVQEYNRNKEWEEIIKEFRETPMETYISPNSTIRKLVDIVDRLTRERECPKPAKYLGIELVSGTLINSVSLFNKHNQNHMSVSFKAAGGATATLKAFDANGNVTNNGIDLTKPVTAISNHPEFFIAAIVTDANGAPKIPLQAQLNGVADGSGTITYSAVSIDGTTLTLVDDVTVADVPPPVPAKSLGVDYVVF